MLVFTSFVDWFVFPIVGETYSSVSHLAEGDPLLLGLVVALVSALPAGLDFVRMLTIIQARGVIPPPALLCGFIRSRSHLPCALSQAATSQT